MKTNSILIWSAISLISAGAVKAQTTFWLNNKSYGSVNSPVFDANGTPLEGSGFQVELWGGATADSLTPTLTAFSNQRVILPFLSGASAGYFVDSYSGRQSSDDLSVFAVPPGSWAWLQVRAWDASLGSTYEQVASLGLGGYGESSVFYAQGGSPFGSLPGPPGPLTGLQSFSLRAVVPEPGSVMLVFLGLPLLLVCRRNQR